MLKILWKMSFMDYINTTTMVEVAQILKIDRIQITLKNILPSR